MGAGRFLSKNGWEWVVFLEKWMGVGDIKWKWLGVGESGWERLRAAGSSWECNSVKPNSIFISNTRS